MELKVKTDIQSLKKEGIPIVIVGAVQESEAVANACKEIGIKVSAVCDSEPRNTEDTLRGLEIIHSPTLHKKFPKARFIIGCQHVQDVVEQLTGYGYDEFYSPLGLIENYDISKFEHSVSNSYMEKRLAVCKKTHRAYFNEEKTFLTT